MHLSGGAILRGDTMKKGMMAALVTFSTLITPTLTFAQYEGTDAKYHEERAKDRAENRKLKYMIYGGVIVLAGGYAAFKKLRERSAGGK